ncbi:MAG: hypothetical protein BBJ57_02350 [Desulfobacterales bacterium PC51MH44]|nr:MAG: hypothetical protein BBJ57_02350 [Desulfobacterales bacterium PC51MH44]
MKYENFKITTIELHRGVQKLVKYGMDTFEMYADEIDMSYCDRNRVIAKCIKAYGKTELKEIPCLKNVIGERWEYYTYDKAEPRKKTMHYKTEKARELLKRIDASYNSPFVPGDITSLARRIG